MDKTTEPLKVLLAEQAAEDAKIRRENNQRLAAGYYAMAFFLLALGAGLIYTLIRFTSLIDVLNSI
jgi:hypothetical protein